MHDVDLLPLSDQLDYSYPQSGPFHIAAPSLHPLYHYPTFIGGILLITKEHFSLVNGLSNRYYGWGREDDEFYVRLKKAGLLKTGYITMNESQTVAYEIRRPQNVSTGLNTFKHIHEKQRRPRDSSNFFDQKAKTNKLDRETGVSTVKYDVKATHHVMLDGAPVTVLDVKLSCDYMKTPWCLKKEDHYLLDSVITQHPPGHR
ncbi:beta-1,4-galactosyltransferase 7-like isoform X2 [Dreissena polymorpha]|nr:beta-1,4-galactosyltransferase 7-like isoform X2 [Dreissena polymorpha]